MRWRRSWPTAPSSGSRPTTWITPERCWSMRPSILRFAGWPAMPATGARARRTGRRPATSGRRSRPDASRSICASSGGHENDTPIRSCGRRQIDYIHKKPHRLGRARQHQGVGHRPTLCFRKNGSGDRNRFHRDADHAVARGDGLPRRARRLHRWSPRDVADHDRARRRCGDDRGGLREREPRDLGSARCRRPHRLGVRSRGELARNRPSACPARGLPALRRVRSEDRAERAACGAPPLPRPADGTRGRRAAARSRRRAGHAAVGRDRPRQARSDRGSHFRHTTQQPNLETPMATTITTFPNQELLQVAETVARDKGIDRDEVLQAMEQAVQKAGRSKYGQEYDIRAEIDRKSGEIRLMRFREVADPVENEATQIPLSDARRLNPEAEIGDFLSDPLPPIDFGRIAAQTAKQVIVQKVRDAERQRQYNEFKNRIGEIVNGLVKRVEFGNVIVDLGRAEAILRRDELLPRESFRQGERVRAYIYDVRQEVRGPQIFLSRTHPQFMAKLFAQEVPEIYDGIIEIRAVARDPGSRAKIAVISKDSSIDPVGACVGMRGVRVQAVVQELQGERIDIIPWNGEPATFIVNALAPAEVTKVVLDEDTHRVEVVVPDEQLSLAIGRRGQNVRLASQLTGWQIDILTEQEESERRQKEFAERTKLFMESLDVDETVAQLLASEGFATIEDVAFVPLNELSAIEGFDEDTAQELQTRATEFIEARNRQYDEKRRELGVTDDVLEIEGVSPAVAVALGEAGIKTLEDLAGCATDDLIGYYEQGKDKERVRVPGALDAFNLSAEEANAIIMKARVKMGWIEEEPQ